MPNALLERLGLSLEELHTLQAALIRVIDRANAPTIPTRDAAAAKDQHDPDAVRPSWQAGNEGPSRRLGDQRADPEDQVADTRTPASSGR